MAPYPPAEKASTAGDCEVLATAYHGLRVANEKLQRVHREICRLMAAKIKHFPHQCESPDRLSEYECEGFTDPEILESDWWEWATRNCLLESVGNLDRELEKTKAWRTELEGIQSDLRCLIDKASRPYLRNLNILDLPDEILLMIFKRVENLNLDTPLLYYYDPGRKDVKNTRLVCRRFCNVSSQLLVRFVNVSFNEQSLARLEEISRHPTIAKGVRIIQIVLHFYNASFTDPDWFISYLADKLEDDVRSFEELKMWEDSNTPEQTASEMIANGKAVALALRRLESTWPEHSEHFEGDEGHRARLNEIHSEYLVLLWKQQSLIRSGRFSEAVGSAIARMPGARKLEFEDADFRFFRGLHLMISAGDVWSALYRLILQPITGHDAKTKGLDLPNYQCIANTIDAVRRSCASLNSINIKLSTLGSPGSLVPSPGIRQQFSSGMQQLVGFEFTCTDCPSEQGTDDVNEFLSACLDTSSLQNLRLDMRSEEVEEVEPRRIDVGRIMGTRSRDRLTAIFFAQVAIDFSRMVQFLNSLPQMACIHQEDVRLLSGTWKDALDALRSKKYRAALLSDPKGAECDDMSREDYGRIFGKDGYRYRTRAELYIANLIPHQPNPLQALEDKP